MQFEIQQGEKRTVIRAKDLDDALRRHQLTDVQIVDTQDVQGWLQIYQNEVEIGQIRPFNRMKFRRD